jgi:hypothetical protein
MVMDMDIDIDTNMDVVRTWTWTWAEGWMQTPTGTWTRHVDIHEIKNVNLADRNALVQG